MAQIDNLLSTTGIHQIAELTKVEWAYIKRLVRNGAAIIELDYSFPRTTKRYFSAV